MDDFTKNNWRKFESLTALLLECEFHLSEDEIFLTRVLKEEGKDVKTTKGYYSKALHFPSIEIWIEAKLRSKGLNVEMSDIAASAIMASNSNITTLYFVTNCFFTTQTIEDLLVFKDNTGLQIFLINGYHYRGLLMKHLIKVEEYHEQAKKNTEDSFDSSFVKELLDILPDKPQKDVLDNIQINVSKGKIVPQTQYAQAIKNEQKIELRKVDIETNTNQNNVLNLNDIKLIPFVTDEELQENVAYQLIGQNRVALMQDIIEYVHKNEIVILKGRSGDGKTFLTHHVARSLYQSNYNVIFTDVYESHILSFTKRLIDSLLQVDYFQLIEEDNDIIGYLADCFDLEVAVAKKIIDLVRTDKFNQSISPEICFEVLIRIMGKFRQRKNILLVIDNLHECSNELLAFLRNLFQRFKELHIPVLCLTISNEYDNIIPEENQWLKQLDIISNTNRFKILTIPELDNSDIATYIQALVPGSNINLINFVERSVFKNPFYINLLIEYLKKKNIIKTANGKYWWLEDTAILTVPEEIRSTSIDTLVQGNLRIILTDKRVRKVASLIFLFNNSLPELILKGIGGLDSDISFQHAGIFQIVYQQNNVIVKFAHDLYYHNLQKVIPKNELFSYASEVLTKLTQEEKNQSSLDDVLGKLYEYTGLYNEANEKYLAFASRMEDISKFTSLLYYEKSLEMLFMTFPHTSYVEHSNEITEIVFKTLSLYNTFNFLSSRKSESYFQLLNKFSDFQQLSEEQSLKRVYYLGLKHTKQEDFLAAEKFFALSYKMVTTGVKVSDKMLDNVIGCYGINLKHIGKKEESLDFFEAEDLKRNRPYIRLQRFSNIAAYYLTIDPQISLENYKKIESMILPRRDLHLIVDIAMANFYLNRNEISMGYLKDAIKMAKKEINLSEEARAENIMALIFWQNGNLEAAEHYLDIALSNGELANNLRWVWRIRANMAQVAFYNKNKDKSYNICKSVVAHLLKTKTAVLAEANNLKINSRRVAALKAMATMFYKMGYNQELDLMKQEFPAQRLIAFIDALTNADGNLHFDSKDQNLFGSNYFILG